MTMFGKMGAIAALVLSVSAAAAGQLLEADSAKGLYHVLVEPGAAPAINTMQSWTLTLQDGNGAPVEGASIAIGGGMPAHGHGLPTEPEVTVDLGEGHYRIDGIKFNMMGRWVIDFQIEAAPGADTARLELDL